MHVENTYQNIVLSKLPMTTFSFRGALQALAYATRTNKATILFI